MKRSTVYSARSTLHATTALALLVSFGAAPSCGQPNSTTDREAVFAALGNLVGGKWVSEGTWGNGSPFRQEHIYRWGPGEAFVTVRTFGFIDDDQTTFGPRNEGIRAWDDQEGVAKFWEFDRFGGISTGIVGLDGDELYYEYVYEIGGETQTLRDSWTRVDDNRYTFKVGSVADGEWTAVYITTEFKRVQTD